MSRRDVPTHPEVKRTLGYKPKTPDAEVLADWKKRVRTYAKPCWELKYCPYGPVVEEFPLPPPPRDVMDEHDAYLLSCLESGRLGNGRKLEKARRDMFKKMVRDYRSADYPESVPKAFEKLFEDVACRVFGHICPVFFVAEPLTETKDRRRQGRSIPREVMLKVVRRDGQICQRCNKPVRDDQVEFDHIIPFSRGGTSTPDNLRLIHQDCNRVKSDSLSELLAENPLVHLFELQQKAQEKRRKAKDKRRPRTG